MQSLRKLLGMLGVAVLLTGCSGSGETQSKPDVGDVQADQLEQDGQVLEDTLTFPDQRVDTSDVIQFDSADTANPDIELPPDQDLHPRDDFGQPCKADLDCESMLCIWDRGQKRCSKLCAEECPVGFQCEQYLPPPDLTFACFSTFPSLCLPCMGSKDCPGSGDRCLVYDGGQGTFCGGACSQDAGCPTGYECKLTKTTEGDQVSQCVLADGAACPCTEWAIENTLVTSCFVTNETGSCPGTRSCGPEGWSQCDAQNPQMEMCFNNIDDDCNGQVDDPTLCVNCDCGDGICQFQCGEYFDLTAGTDVFLNCAVDCAVCGNAMCEPGESPETCPQDCCGSCGDGLCRPGVCGETGASCPDDCGPDSCGDNTCQAPENAVDCPLDCAPTGCGNLSCEPDEDVESCSTDCSATCGDCICQASESSGQCPGDCGYCGDGFCLDLCPAMYAAENVVTCFQDCCVPDCTGRVCGPDGCGGSCGSCGAGFVCSDLGTCFCVAQCQGKECGEDGCGGTCGSCSLGTKCDFGLCMIGCDLDTECPPKYECYGGFCALDLVDNLTLLEPIDIVTTPDVATPALAVGVSESGLTSSPGAAPGLVVEFGYSSLGWDPRIHPEAWVWTTATYASDETSYDRYTHSQGATAPGEYFYTFRATLEGTGFQYADTTGLLDGFDPAKVGHWSVTAPPALLAATPLTASVLGGDQILLTGSGFQQGLIMTVDGTPVTPASITSTQILFTAPSHKAGSVAVAVRNPDQQASSLPAAYQYVHRFTPTLDGNLSEWSSLLQAGSNSLVSNWDASKNKLTKMYVAFDSNYVYVAIEGYSESMNYILCYMDFDFGANSGVKQMVWLSDNTGNGDLDDAFSSVLEVSVPGYGADWGFGTRGMASFTQGSDLGGSLYVGWRAMGTPYNLPWFQGTVKSGNGAIEAAVPLSTVLPQGIPAAGTEVALFAKITDRYGDMGGICNQTLPEYFDAGDVKKIDAVATFTVR